jgi:hybrid cluster-associated redox disulfide protein
MTEIKITKKSSIGEIIKNYPEAEPVIKKYFGSGCFTCPGSKMEDLAFGAMMHNMDPEIIVKEINDAVAVAKKKG